MTKIKQLAVEPVVVDLSISDPLKSKDLLRADRETLPANLIYPSNYSSGTGGFPAIMLEGAITPGQALEALEIVERWSNEG